MRSLTFYIVFTLALFCSFTCDASEKSELMVIAKSIKQAILLNDSSVMQKYVHSDGVYFMDDKMSRDEVIKSLQNKESTLYRYLFGNTGSIKNYLQTADKLKIRIIMRDKTSAIVSFPSINHEPEEWKECCFIKRKNKWYFDGIFYCE